ncbi:MAG: hypothetical protein HY913_19575 [Desulfomonile tiedjei]|nr:hypothetical protein [Desulfomonile tiedjei]
MNTRGQVFQERALLILILFVGLLLIDPLIPASVANLPFAVIGVAGAWLLTEKKSFSRHLILVMALAVLVLFSFAKLSPPHVLETIRVPVGLLLLASTLTLYALCAGLILMAMLKATEVTHHQIISAVNLYLILGMFWAHFYTILDWLQPGAFGLPSQGEHPASQFIYFSFVTLATLGYGDITPKTEFAQRLAITEAIVGQFYASVVVAYLLSLFIRQKLQAKGEGPKDGTGPSD